MVTSRRSWCF